MGAHKCNNTKLSGSCVGSELNVKKRGRPIANNAYLEGIYVKARTRILIGHEIFVDYEPCKNSIQWKKKKIT